MIKYNCLNPIAACGLDKFTDAYEKTDNFAEADVALVRSAAMHDMDLPESLIAVARAGAGVNNIPLDKCAEKGIVVFNTPGANANGVKELVLAGMLLACRDIIGGIQWVKDNKDDEGIGKAAEKAKKAFAGCEIKGKTLGVIGLGAIGVQVANAAAKLGMKVMGYDPYLSVNAAWNVSNHVEHVTSADEVYKKADFITIHVPLLESTKHMISEDCIKMMKATAVVLNFSRDSLVDEKAMVQALKEGRVAKYIVDFPTPITAGQEGCIVIPHLGASTEESEDNCAMMAVDEIRDYVENGNITHSVNYPDCNMGVCSAVSRIAIIHTNVPNTIGRYSSILGSEGINISGFTDRAKGDYAYSLIDVDHVPTEAAIEKLASTEGVIKIRVVK